mmetsp:Transcript_21110/g.43881  ORF Transcript_21110/g.43881 Transcript_21110/m.43881 type:complete len:240 (-) Transcript_21110:644-1363(-)
MTPSPAASSLAAIAARIHERNNALSSELSTLDLLQSQYEHAEECLEADRKASMDVRKEFLTAARSLHGVELEIFRVKEESASIEKSTMHLKSKIDEIRHQTDELRRKFHEEQSPMFAAHDLSMNLYSRKSETLLVRAQRRKQRREEKLSKLNERIARQRKEAQDMCAKRQRIKEECLDMSRSEEEEDEEAVALNLQIKSIIGKKASARATLNDARDEYQNAVDYRDSWERKCAEANKDH